jgi:hypothetical protein
MNKVWIYGILALVLLGSVMAATIDYKARCDFIMPATEYRPERVFYGIGMFGALSDGSLVCFVPGSTPKPVLPPVVVPVVVPEPEPVPVCEDVETCEEVCTWDWGWYKSGRHWRIGWHEDCEEECTIENVCEEVA